MPISPVVVSLAFKRHLIAAAHQFFVDNGDTPMISVINNKESQLPSFLTDEILLLNVHPEACRDLEWNRDGVSFQARFQGKVELLWLPWSNILAITDKDATEGLQFIELSFLQERQQHAPMHWADLPDEVTVRQAKKNKKSATSRRDAMTDLSLSSEKQPKADQSPKQKLRLIRQTKS